MSTITLLVAEDGLDDVSSMPTGQPSLTDEIFGGLFVTIIAGLLITSLANALIDRWNWHSSAG